ncbi:hypothetical protein BO71DRAFT_317030 [Aspergillus ellipticus CBS 707.79]|uniref:DUF6536 domain-containing protein n=1 Tax=Aspergillus ellipticus CBS 707.79 TaxID=1448320 RepID=A0A319EBK3_9EURO|nr:hypothetical protein BO71DRAFT_317030 [Aspergillus ellipticus CBS 707.79]
MRSWRWPSLQNIPYRQVRRGSRKGLQVDADCYELTASPLSTNDVDSAWSVDDKGPVRPQASISSWKLSDARDRQKRWVKGVLVCAYATSAVLLVNVILTIVATAISFARHGQYSLTAVTIYHGSCIRTKSWTTGLHLVINVLSTVVLAASSYCMQCLSSPSRSEVDRAHAERIWLDVGVSSVRNLTFAGWTRRGLWLALLMTSVPIHLIYNSAVFFALGTKEYNVLLASTDFDFDHAPTNTNASYTDCFEPNTAMNMSTFYADLPDFQNLTTKECYDQYATDFPANLGTLILVTRNLTVASKSLQWVGTGNPPADYSAELLTSSYGWMCLGDEPLLETTSSCDKSRLLTNVESDDWIVSVRVPWSGPVVNATMHLPNGSTTWSSKLEVDVENLEQRLMSFPSEEGLRRILDNATYWENGTWAQEVGVQATDDVACARDYRMAALETWPYVVDYCLSHETSEHCELQFSPAICVVVLACNAVKVVCMFWTARADRKEIFLTVGDAIASFLTRPDPATARMGLLSRANLRQGPQPWRSRRAAYWPLAAKDAPQPQAWATVPPRQRWIKAVHVGQWIGTVLICLVVLSVGGYLLSVAIQGLQDQMYSTSLAGLWDLGFGTATPYTILPFAHSSVISMALLANSPQLVISVAYFLYNNLLTHMLLVAEYDGYASQRKPLRVSWPEGGQRSTYYLSLPYRYSVPLLVASMLLHWLVSASLFYVEVIPFDTRGDAAYGDQIIACGYAPIAIIFAIVLGFMMISAILSLSLKRLQSHMPMAGSCSAAISAACHPGSTGEHAFKPLMWGEIIHSGPDRMEGTAGEDGIGVPDTDGRDGDGSGERAGGSDGYARVAGGVSDGEAGYGHCSFTSDEVVAPNPLRLYI